MKKQTKFFLKWIPEYMKQHNGWIKVKRAFRALTKQKQGTYYSPRHKKLNAWQMQKALMILESQGIVERWSEGIWRLKR